MRIQRRAFVLFHVFALACTGSNEAPPPGSADAKTAGVGGNAPHGGGGTGGEIALGGSSGGFDGPSETWIAACESTQEYSDLCWCNGEEPARCDSQAELDACLAAEDCVARLYRIEALELLWGCYAESGQCSFSGGDPCMARVAGSMQATPKQSAYAEACLGGAECAIEDACDQAILLSDALAEELASCYGGSCESALACVQAAWNDARRGCDLEGIIP